MAIASAFERFPQAVAPSVKPKPAPSARDWRTGLPVLQGAAVALRELRASDAPALLTAFGSPEVTRLISPPPADRRGVREVHRVDATAARQPDSRASRSCRRTPTRRSACSRCGRSSRIRHRGVGLRARAEFWGTGMFTDGARLVLDFAFDVLGVHRLEARAALQNGRGNGALRKLGASQEGVLRQSFLRNGELPRPGALDDPRRRVAQGDVCLRRTICALSHPANMTRGLDVRDFDFDLPPELIAQEPAARARRIAAAPASIAQRAASSTRQSPTFPTCCARAISWSSTTRGCFRAAARPARAERRRRRVSARRAARSTAQAARSRPVNSWEALMHPGQKLKPGRAGDVRRRRDAARRGARAPFPRPPRRPPVDRGRRRSVDEAVDAIGHMPLPPYIKRDDRADDRDRYQTVFARERGSVAAPTAGLHFTPALLDARSRRAASTIAEITLHVGYGTFQPVRVERVEDHRLEPERYEIGAEAAARDQPRARRGPARRRRRHDDDADARGGGARARRPPRRRGRGDDLFIYPGFAFRVVGGLLTNFHLPRSSLLMLVSAFAGRERCWPRMRRPSRAVPVLQLRRRDAGHLNAVVRSHVSKLPE